MDVASLRAEFPVLERAIYMNAGTDGPIPRRAWEAAQAAVRVEVEDGRAGKAHFETMMRLRDSLRERVAGLIGATTDEVALTGSTTDGVNAALVALALGPGDEVLTTDEEHPGVLGPLGAHSRRGGFDVRVVPWAEIASAVSPKTKLIACSHVSWVNGKEIDIAALRATGVQILLDGAQSLGAIPVNVKELGVDFFAAAGQKWMCGPDGTGYLYVRDEVAERLDSAWPGYMTLAAPDAALTSPPAPGARRFDMGVVPAAISAWCNTSFDVFAGHGWDAVHARATTLAGELADRLSDSGHTVAPRGNTTLVSWHADDPEGTVERLGEAGILARYLPGRGLVRASVGAWATEDDLHRLVNAL